MILSVLNQECYTEQVPFIHICKWNKLQEVCFVDYMYSMIKHYEINRRGGNLLFSNFKYWMVPECMEQASFYSNFLWVIVQLDNSLLCHLTKFDYE